MGLDIISNFKTHWLTEQGFWNTKDIEKKINHNDIIKSQSTIDLRISPGGGGGGGGGFCGFF